MSRQVVQAQLAWGGPPQPFDACVGRADVAVHRAHLAAPNAAIGDAPIARLDDQDSRSHTASPRVLPAPIGRWNGATVRAHVRRRVVRTRLPLPTQPAPAAPFEASADIFPLQPEHTDHRRRACQQGPHRALPSVDLPVWHRREEALAIPFLPTRVGGCPHRAGADGSVRLTPVPIRAISFLPCTKLVQLLAARLRV